MELSFFAQVLELPKLPNRITYEQVQQFIDKLDSLCGGQSTASEAIQFDLPTEWEFVHMATQLYPLNSTTELLSCSELGNKEWQGVKKLLGNKWQFTKSQCLDFIENLPENTESCNQDSIVLKGGTAEVGDPGNQKIFCLPRYRSQARKDTPLLDTTFRLVLGKDQRSQFKEFQ